LTKNDIIQYLVCMPRIARVVVKGLPSHVTRRVNYRQSVFEDDNFISGREAIPGRNRSKAVK
jgi:REP element-mobilizing transposase RayT